MAENHQEVKAICYRFEKRIANDEIHILTVPIKDYFSTGIYRVTSATQGSYVSEFVHKSIDADFKNSLIKGIRNTVDAQRTDLLDFANELMIDYREQQKQIQCQTKTEETEEEKKIEDEAMQVIKENRLMDLELEALESHQDEKANKILLVLSNIHAGISNLVAPPHTHFHGNPESGKTDLMSKNKMLIPLPHVAPMDGITSKALFYSKLEPKSLIVLNDQIITDEIASTLNQLCDLRAYQFGFIRTVTVDKEAKTYCFPPKCLIHFSSNKKISQYHCEAVDTSALESRFMSIEKYYTDEQKKEITTGITENKIKAAPDITHKIAVIRKALKWYYDNPIDVKHELSINEYEKYESSFDATEIRKSSLFLAYCQCLARYKGRDHVTTSDIKEIADLIEYVNPKKITPRQQLILSCIPDGIISWKWIYANQMIKKIAKKPATIANDIKKLEELGFLIIDRMEKEHKISRKKPKETSISTPLKWERTKDGLPICP